MWSVFSALITGKIIEGQGVAMVHENVSPFFSDQTLSTHRKGFQNLHRNSQSIQKIW